MWRQRHDCRHIKIFCRMAHETDETVKFGLNLGHKNCLIIKNNKNQRT